MRIDPDKLRQILTLLADQPAELNPNLAGAANALLDACQLQTAELSEYVHLLIEANFVEGRREHCFDGGVAVGFVYVPFRLTWEGHQYLNSVRSDTVYAKSKEIAKTAFGIVTLETIKAALPFALTQLLKAHGFSG